MKHVHILYAFLWAENCELIILTFYDLLICDLSQLFGADSSPRTPDCKGHLTVVTDWGKQFEIWPISAFLFIIFQLNCAWKVNSRIWSLNSILWIGEQKRWPLNLKYGGRFYLLLALPWAPRGPDEHDSVLRRQTSDQPRQIFLQPLRVWLVRLGDLL